MPKVKKFVITWSLIVIIGAILSAVFLWWFFSPANPSDMSVRHITVAKGESVRGIADMLEEEGIIRSSFSLLLILRGRDGAGKIQSGSYELSPSMTVGRIADELLIGSKDVWITLIEGWRVEEISDEMTKTLGMRFFDPSEFLELAKPNEGKLFPDTYLFPRQSSASLIVNTLLSNFEKKYEQALSQVGKPKLTKDETIVLASILEREARNLKDKKIVAGILMNRLENKIALQVDATLQYIKGYDNATKTWWPQPKAADKDLKSPFNTYLNRGLPPAPICNPGMDSIVAAIRPTDTNYLYYITDSKGQMHYAQTLDEHNANVVKYLR